MTTTAVNGALGATAVETAAPATGATQRELELKLLIPPHAKAALRKVVMADVKWSRAITMQARYFDTQDRLLARAGMALRVRREGRVWVQVLKVSRSGSLARDEYAVARPDGTLDHEALRSTPAGALLESRPAAASALTMRFETLVRRKTRRVRARSGSVEFALDEGWITDGEHRIPLSELEIELVRGSPQAVFSQALRWRRRFGLVVDARTKAERGDRLARSVAQNEPRRASRVKLDGAMSPGAALRAIATECAAQIQSNAADLATGAGTDEHVHQLRIGVRRLRSAWRFFDEWTQPPPQPLVEGARAVFAGMGVARDAAVIEGEIEPRLRAAGMPQMQQVAADRPSHPGEYAAGPAVQEWLIGLLAWIEEIDTAPSFLPEAGPTGHHERAELMTIARIAAHRLRGWHESLCAPADAFASLSDVDRHRLRKRAKRLRYAMEFCRDLLDRKRYARCAQRLEELQQVLGELNDLVVARGRYEQAAQSDPAAWFARGWIAARAESVVPRAVAAFARLSKAGPVRQ